jgi:hypothetical protein
MEPWRRTPYFKLRQTNEIYEIVYENANGETLRAMGMP